VTSCGHKTHQPKRTTMAREYTESAATVRAPENPHVLPEDPWAHRASTMRCSTCMFYVAKALPVGMMVTREIGRCRRHAPTMSGYPAVFNTDWCGDHKIDENKL